MRPPAEVVGEEDRRQQQEDAETLEQHGQREPDEPPAPEPVEPELPDSPTAEIERRVRFEALDLAERLRATSGTPDQMVDDFADAVERDHAPAVHTLAETRRTVCESEGEHESRDAHPVIRSRRLVLAAVDEFAVGAEMLRKGLAEIDPDHRFTESGKAERREEVRKDVDRQHFDPANATLGKAGDPLRGRLDAKTRQLEKRLAEHSPTTEEDATVATLDALLIATRLGEDPNRFDAVIHALAFTRPRTAARLLDVEAVTTSDPLALQRTVRSLSSRLASVRRTDLLEDPEARPLLAELHLVRKAMEAVETVAAFAHDRPTEVTLMRDLARKTFDRLS